MTITRLNPTYSTIEIGTASSNANNYIIEGRYNFSTGNTMSNMPSGCGAYGVLCVFTRNTSRTSQWHAVIQLCMSGTTAWMRSSYDGNWGAWARLT